MTGSTEAVPEIVRDLLHSTPEIRRTAFNRLKTVWTEENAKDLREYLWRAIEQEKSKALQAEQIAFALREVADHGLRKMIRFVEKDQLHPRAVNNFIEGYCTYEDQKARIALVKSLRRDQSKTHKFVIKLLQSTPFQKEYGIYQEYKELSNPRKWKMDFVLDIIGEDVPIKRQKAIAEVLFYFSAIQYDYPLSFTFVKDEVLKQYPRLQAHIIAVFLSKTQSQSAYASSKTMLEHRQVTVLMWDKPDIWKVSSYLKELDRGISNDFLDKFTSLDEFLLESVLSRSSLVRRVTIQTLAERTPDFESIDIGGDETTYYHNFLDVLDYIYRNRLNEALYETEVFNIETLTELDIHLVDEENDNEVPLVYRMQGANINPVELVRSIYLDIPRNNISKLLQDDPAIHNRLLAYESLQQQDFWARSLPHGSPYAWYNTFTKALNAIQFEDHPDLQKAARDLIISLVDLLLQHDSPLWKIFRGNFLQLARPETGESRLQRQIQELHDLPYAQTAIMKIEQLLLGRPINLAGIQVTSDDPLLKELTENLQEREQLLSLLTVYQENSVDVKQEILSYLQRRAANSDKTGDNIFPQTAEEATHIQVLLELAQQAKNINIRSKAQLLANRLDRRFITEIMSNLNDNNVDYLITLFEVEIPELNSKILKKLDKRLELALSDRRRNLNIDQHILDRLQLLVTNDQLEDFQNQKLANTIQSKLDQLAS